MSISELSPPTLLEFAYFMTGKEIGGGMSRKVYEHPFDRDKVIKIENSTQHFQNVREWEIWSDYKMCPEVAKWLAPCYAISHSGTFLIMAKTEPIFVAPKRLPEFLTDHKLANYGKYKGRVVCHDYGRTVLSFETKMRKWKGEEE